MSKRNPSLLISDMIISIAKIKEYTLGLNFEEFLADSKTVEAVERNFEIIGEAANQIPKEFQMLHPEVSWYSIISFKNRLILNYFGVDYEILWTIIQNDLQVLGKNLSSIK